MRSFITYLSELSRMAAPILRASPSFLKTVARDKAVTVTTSSAVLGSNIAVSTGIPESDSSAALPAESRIMSVSLMDAASAEIPNPRLPRSTPFLLSPRAALYTDVSDTPMSLDSSEMSSFPLAMW